MALDAHNDTDESETKPQIVEKNPILTAIGMMSGTSMDGIDVAVIETNGNKIFRTGVASTYPYQDDLRYRLRAVSGRNPDGHAETPTLIRDVTDSHAEALDDFLARNGLAHADIDLIGFHGQTVFHDPHAGVTRQLADGQRLSDRMGIRVVSEFRAADVAHGGEGAPFAPVYHAALSKQLDKPLGVLNLGGVGNVTWIGDQGGLIAFDTGPANAMLDDWMHAHSGKKMDDGGEIARKGRVDERVLQQLLDDPYFNAPYPKSLDRDHFDSEPVSALSLEDGAATLTAFSAACVERAESLLPSPPVVWLVTGGGRHNPVLMGELRSRLRGSVDPVETVGWNGDFLEAQAFGFLAVRSLFGMPLSYPTTTGIPRPLTGGVLSTPA